MMTPLEDKQRTRRFYFYVAFWLISVAIAFFSGFESGKIVADTNVNNTMNDQEVLDLVAYLKTLKELAAK